MAVTVFDHPVLSGLFGDPEVTVAFGPNQRLDALIRYEVALTRAVGKTGLIPQDKADAIIRACENFHLDTDDLRDDTIRDGLPVPAFVRKLKAYLGPDLAPFVHFGATSQDLSDTGVSLALKSFNPVFARRLKALLAMLDELDRQFGGNEMTGRTRMQAALPITVSDRIAAWRPGLEIACRDFPSVRSGVEVLQTGGPVGTNSAFGDRADEIVAMIAAELELQAPDRSWHAARNGRAAYADWMSRVTGALGKIGQDIALMAQQGVDEVSLSGGGGSSAMAHKNNPVAAEILVALARFNAVQVSGMHHALVHEQERSGAAWALEWMILPQMCAATGAAMLNADRLLGAVRSIGREEAD